MSTIGQVKYYKENNIKWYYIDSDGDEVIVSDEEDFEVALDYARAKGDGKVLFLPSKSIQESVEVKEEEKEHKKDVLNMVAETVSVDENENFDSSSSSDSDIEEIEDEKELLKIEEKKDEFKIQETVSKENSICSIPNDRNSFADPSDDFANVESEYDFDSVDGKFTKAVSSSDVDSNPKLENEDDEIINQFDVIQSQVNNSVYNRVVDYVEKNKESALEELKEIVAENNELNNSDQKVSF